MRIEIGAWGNCSESVFRFMTLDPKQIQFILQAIADEINANTGFVPHQNQKVPLFETAEKYDSKYVKASDKDWDRHFKFAQSLTKYFNAKKITKEQCDKAYEKEDERFSKLQYPKGSLLKACAGLGDNEAIVTIENKKKAFRLNIGNNDISNNKTDWIGKVMSLGIKVQEGEFSKELAKYGRDCLCGISYFDDYKNLIKDKKTENKEVEQNI